MLRFPNPGSDIAAFVRTFKTLFKALKSQPSFSLDDMSRALVGSNLATSSGHIGDEALRRSTREDRSRDPLFNQSKMYSELVRILGWIHTPEDKKQQFNFTFLGEHIALDTGIPDDLIKECILRITYPNPQVEVKGGHRLRPMATILLMAKELDGRISRDEIILGPLQLINDRDRKEVDLAINRIQKLRKAGSVKSTLDAYAEKAKIQLNTLHNYTRFPLGMLRWAGWANPTRDGRGVEYTLTDLGATTAQRVRDSIDIRSEDLIGAPEAEVLAFIKLAFYRMMEIGGFSLADIPENKNDLINACRSLSARLQIKDMRGILFSPFQECESAPMARIFPPYTAESASTPSREKAANSSSGTQRALLITRIKLSTSEESSVQDKTNSPIIDLIQKKSLKQDIDATTEAVFQSFRGAGKATFYPAIADLFSYLGFECTCSRTGVNYQRMDALILDKAESVPIEIKSPGEEEFLSVKGVRQALENKVVLLARRYAPTLPQTTSLAVGYEPPNNRSEVSSLVSDIYTTYKISIGIIDFRTLIRLATTKHLQGHAPKRADILRLRGLLEIENT